MEFVQQIFRSLNPISRPSDGFDAEDLIEIRKPMQVEERHNGQSDSAARKSFQSMSGKERICEALKVARPSDESIQW